MHPGWPCKWGALRALLPWRVRKACIVQWLWQMPCVGCPTWHGCTLRLMAIVPAPLPLAVYLFIRVQQPVMPWWKGEACCCRSRLDVSRAQAQRRGLERQLMTGRHAPTPSLSPTALLPCVPLPAKTTPTASHPRFVTCIATATPPRPPAGDKASVCISDKEGECRPQTPPIPPPVKEESCSANVCFLLDGSKSLINVVSCCDLVVQGTTDEPALHCKPAVLQSSFRRRTTPLVCCTASSEAPESNQPPEPHPKPCAVVVAGRVE